MELVPDQGIDIAHPTTMRKQRERAQGDHRVIDGLRGQTGLLQRSAKGIGKLGIRVRNVSSSPSLSQCSDPACHQPILRERLRRTIVEFGGLKKRADDIANCRDLCLVSDGTMVKISFDPLGAEDGLLPGPARTLGE